MSAVEMKGMLAVLKTIEADPEKMHTIRQASVQVERRTIQNKPVVNSSKEYGQTCLVFNLRTKEGREEVLVFRMTEVARMHLVLDLELAGREK